MLLSVAVRCVKLVYGNFFRSFVVMLCCNGRAQLRNTPACPERYKRISVSPQLLRSCSQPDTGQLSGTTHYIKIRKKGRLVLNSVIKMSLMAPVFVFFKKVSVSWRCFGNVVMQNRGQAVGS